MIFKRLRFKNLLSFGNLFTEIDLSSSRMNLIVGSNGSGKSGSLIDALCFGLFNKPFRSIRKLQLVNSITKGELLVEVEFSIGPDEYLVRRGIKPAVFEIERNGELLNQDSANKDMQSYLERKVLRTNYNTFVQVVILGSASYVPFMQLPAGRRREIVEELYDLKIFTLMNAKLKKKLDLVERSIDKLESQKRLVEQELKLSRKHQNVLNEDKEKRISGLETELLEHRGTVSRLEGGISNLKSEYQAGTESLKEFDKDEKRRQKLLQYSRDVINSIGVIKRELSFLEENCDCPTCKQVLDEEFKERTIAEKRVRLKELTDGQEKLKVELESVDERLQSKKDRERSLESDRTKIAVSMTELTGHQKQIRKIELEIASIQEEKERVVDVSKVKDLEAQIKARSVEKNELLKNREMMEYVGVLLKDSGIKAKIIKKYSGTFNELVNAYLARFEFFVDFHLDENFEETIKSRGRDDFSYNSFSEGEKLRIDLAVLFAWRDVAKMRASLSTNLCIFDEILDSALDQVGISEVVKILNDKDQTNVFVISHRSDQVSDTFDRILKFSKTKGFSKMEVVQ